MQSRKRAIPVLILAATTLGGLLVRSWAKGPAGPAAESCASPTAAAKTSGGAIGPDIIVGMLQAMDSYGHAVGISAFSVATTSCNKGDAEAKWVGGTREHPVIAQNMYRLKNDRFEQIGMSWVKHAFAAINEDRCLLGCQHPLGGITRLGVGCSDPYAPFLNGLQRILGPRSQVNAHSGFFTYPPNIPNPSCTGCSLIDRRLQVHDVDLDPTLNPNASYFVEGQYVSADDALAGNGNNNASYRPAIVTQGPAPGGCNQLAANGFCVRPTGGTQREQAAVRAWQDRDPLVVETDVQVPGEGLFILAAKSIDLGGGVWQYEYALQNLNSNRAGRSFSVPLPLNATVDEVGFHDVDYHSGEPYDGTDWPATVVAGSITWSTADATVDENANALRWGTLYNFWFRADVPPDSTSVTIGLFKPGLPQQVQADSIGPLTSLVDCNQNGVADACDIDCQVSGCIAPCGGSTDCNVNTIPDDCEGDCNNNQVPDPCDLSTGTSSDCNNNLVPDECEPDCDGDGIPDECDTFDDCDADGVADCFDRCPCTTSVKCVCPQLGECCFPDSGVCLQNFPLSTCVEDGGVPDCVEVPCVDGCTCAASAPPQPDWIPDAAGVLVPSMKNRYLSFSAGEPGRMQAVRVTLVTLPPPFDVFNGLTMWVGPPRAVSESGGLNRNVSPTFNAALLLCEPFYTDWSPFGIVHAYHSVVVPNAVYELQVVDMDCPGGDESSFSAPLTVRTSGWGDVAGPFRDVDQVWTAPDGAVDVTVDVIAQIEKFRGSAHAPIKARADLDPATPDQLVNVTDFLRGLNAFKGLSFPFKPSRRPCGASSNPRIEPPRIK